MRSPDRFPVIVNAFYFLSGEPLVARPCFVSIRLTLDSPLLDASRFIPGEIQNGRSPAHAAGL
jgi:hypothetical protein